MASGQRSAVSDQGQRGETSSPRKTGFLTGTAGIVAAGVLMAGLVRLLLTLPERVVWGDEPFYLWLGRNWINGRGYSFTGHPDVHHTPLYPLLTGLVSLLTGDSTLASNACYVVFGALLGLPIYGIARRLYGRPTAVIALALLAVYPALTGAVLHWGTLTEPPYYFFVYSAFYFLLVTLERLLKGGDIGYWVPGIGDGKASQPVNRPTSQPAKYLTVPSPNLPIESTEGRPIESTEGWPIALTGASIALAYLTRPEAIAHVLVILALVVGFTLLAGRLFTRQTMLALFAFVLAFFVFFFPYMVYVRVNTGAWMVSEKAGVTFSTGIAFAYGRTAQFDQETWGLDSTGKEVFFFSPESYGISITDYIRNNPRDFARLVYMNVRRFWSTLFSDRLFPIWLLPIVALGWFAAPWDRRRLWRELYWAAAIVPVLGFLIFFIQERYIATLLPVLIVWLSHGLWQAGRWLSETARKLLPALSRFDRVLLALPATMLVFYSLIALPEITANTSLGGYRPAHRTVGLWLQANAPAGVVMSRYPAIAYHADDPWVATPNADLPAVLNYARAKGARYFVIDERELPLRPQLAPLIKDEPAPAGLTRLYAETIDGERIVIYQLP